MSVSNVKRQLEIYVGKAETLVGTLAYLRQGRREHSIFAYAESWLRNPNRFAISPDLPLVTGYQSRKAPSEHDSTFHGAVADTAPDAWGRRIIARDHAKRRAADPSLAPLDELDYLLAVDDFSRTGALRFGTGDGAFSRTVDSGKRRTPPLVDMSKIYRASRAVEKGEESSADLSYLQGKGTSLGGTRPKCTIIDDDGHLAIGKFPSVNDARAVTRGEVLTLELARRAGIDAASARIVELEGTPIAVIRRFDRDDEHGRIPYMSAASLLQASRKDDHAYTEIADSIRAIGAAPIPDLQQLWRRLLFNLLVTNVDDHLQNHALLHTNHGLWRLAPAFDLNPFPDKARESKTWLSEDSGPITDVTALMDYSEYFALDRAHALSIVREIHDALVTWRDIARGTEVGMRTSDLEDFAPAFEHEQTAKVRDLLGRT